MGTNFYMMYREHFSNGDHKDNHYHLGKSSGGWEFTFRGDRKNKIVDLRSWYAFAKQLSDGGYTLTNDNGSGIKTLVELLKLIKENKGKMKSTVRDDWEWLDESGNYFMDREFS